MGRSPDAMVMSAVVVGEQRARPGAIEPDLGVMGISNENMPLYSGTTMLERHRDGEIDLAQGDKPRIGRYVKETLKVIAWDMYHRACGRLLDARTRNDPNQLQHQA